MPKPEWGVKRACPSCGARFYDLARSPIICPECEAPFEVAVKDKAASLKADLARARSASKAKAAELVDEDDDVEEPADDQEEPLLEDDDRDDAGTPALSDEDDDGDKPVKFDEDALLDEDDKDDEDGEDPIEDLDELPASDDSET